LNKNQYAGNMYHDLIAPISDKVCDLPQITLKTNYEMPFAGDFVALHPGVSKMSVMKNMIKCPEASFWRELIEGILAKGKKVVLLGGPDDDEIISQIGNFENENFYNLYGKTKNLQELASIISKSSAFICADSAPMHIAVALNKNIFAIFGPTDDKKLIPNADNFRVIKGARCDMQPCLWARRQTTCDTLECLKINSDDIISKI
jgi:ADP-heptose:LPS heptosyltransferase